MTYDERACKFNMDTGCVELLLRDGRKIFIGCIGVEDALDVTMAQRAELDYLIYNDPLLPVKCVESLHYFNIKQDAIQPDEARRAGDCKPAEKK